MFCPMKASSRILRTVLIFTFIISGMTLRLSAAVDDHWDDMFGAPGVDTGTVYAIEGNGSDVYVGGTLTAAGEAVSPGIAKWDGANWMGLAGGVSGASAVVYSIAAHGSDIYAGGYYTNAGATAAKSLARWDGKQWNDVGGGVNGLIFVAKFIGNNLYVGGNFTKAGNVAATNIARWDGTNWWPLGNGVSGNTNGIFAYVHALAADMNGNLYAGGLFRNAGAVPVSNVARWDGTNWSALGSGVYNGTSPGLNDVKYYNGALYVAGAFSSASGVNATNLARWDGTNWFAMGGGPNGTNTAIVTLGTNFYTTGIFTNIAGVRMLYAAHWNGSSWDPVIAGTAGEISSDVSSAAGINGHLYVGGNFIRAGNAGVIGVARWDGTQWSGLVGPRTKGVFLSGREIKVIDGNVYLGSGGMSLAGGVLASRIARFDGTNWDNMGGGVIGGGSVNTIVKYNGTICVGGSFTNIGGVVAKNAAYWDGANWHSLASGLNNTVNVMLVHNGTLFAGGTFTARGDSSASVHGITQWDGSDWQDVPTISAWSGANSINAMASDGVNLYIGGNFYIGWQISTPPFTGDDLLNIGYWDGTTWHSMGAGLTNTVNGLAFYNGQLYAGGSFTNSGATKINRVAVWNGSVWSNVSAGFTNGTISAVTASAGYLYVGGSFTNYNGGLIYHVARWDGSLWSSLGSGVTNVTGSSVAGIGVSENDVYLAGTFSRAGGKDSLGVAHWNETVSYLPPVPLQLLNSRWQSGQFAFDISGITSGNFSVWACTNQTNWQIIHSDSAPNTNFIDSDSGVYKDRFYRVTRP